MLLSITSYRWAVVASPYRSVCVRAGLLSPTGNGNIRGFGEFKISRGGGRNFDFLNPRENENFEFSPRIRNSKFRNFTHAFRAMSTAVSVDDAPEAPGHRPTRARRPSAAAAEVADEAAAVTSRKAAEKAARAAPAGGAGRRSTSPPVREGARGGARGRDVRPRPENLLNDDTDDDGRTDVQLATTGTPRGFATLVARRATREGEERGPSARWRAPPQPRQQQQSARGASAVAPAGGGGAARKKASSTRPPRRPSATAAADEDGPSSQHNQGNIEIIVSQLAANSASDWALAPHGPTETRKLALVTYLNNAPRPPVPPLRSDPSSLSRMTKKVKSVVEAWESSGKAPTGGSRSRLTEFEKALDVISKNRKENAHKRTTRRRSAAEEQERVEQGNAAMDRAVGRAGAGEAAGEAVSDSDDDSDAPPPAPRAAAKRKAATPASRAPPARGAPWQDEADMEAAEARTAAEFPEHAPGDAVEGGGAAADGGHKKKTAKPPSAVERLTDAIAVGGDAALRGAEAADKRAAAQLVAAEALSSRARRLRSSMRKRSARSGRRSHAKPPLPLLPRPARRPRSSGAAAAAACRRGEEAAPWVGA